MINVIGIGTYLKEDYDEILSISDDRDTLDQTWEDWKSNKERTKKRLESKGLKLADILVHPKKLVKFCRARGLKINGNSRSRFVSEKAMSSNK